MYKDATNDEQLDFHDYNLKHTFLAHKKRREQP